MEDILIMNQKELNRLHIIRKAIDKHLKQREVACLLKLSQRQVRRLVKRVRKESNKGIIHRLRGIRSHRMIPETIKNKVLALCRGKYEGFSPTFASEKLFERNKIKISRETIRQWFIAEGLPYEKRKARPHRSWRERKTYYGEMLQMDGSHHDWFEGRAAPCVLMGYIDDATGRVYAQFYEYEGTFPAMDSFKRYALKYGLPQSVYLDRHTTYKGTRKPTTEEELLDLKPLSQFGRALEELGVTLIHAQSAQAKGRIERLFKTFQDRLVKEMRLSGIGSIQTANEFLKAYLPGFNRRFSVEALSPDDLHRPLPEGIDLNKILAIKTIRALRNDFTVVHEGRLYQVKDNIRAREVIVEERINGSLLITHKARALRYKEIAQRPKKIKQPYKMRQIHIHPKDHHWRSFKFGSLDIKGKKEIFANAL
ncbi:MAG: ISNCY family transposase [Candidatus Omnitrophota bacterium]